MSQIRGHIFAEIRYPKKCINCGAILRKNPTHVKMKYEFENDKAIIECYDFSEIPECKFKIVIPW